MSTLVFDDALTGDVHVIEVGRLLIAGFTGRDTEAVTRHIEELAAMGVPVPDTTPTLYELDPALVRQTTALVVGAQETSGEVEPVVVVAGGRRLLTVGSDHTDRLLEREDIAASKAACAKPIASRAVDLESIESWDTIEMRSIIDEKNAPYQEGTLASLLPLEALLTQLEASHGLTLQDGDVLFLGTLPTIGGIRPSQTFSAELDLNDGSSALRLDYRIVDLTSAGRSPMAKPEFEFFNVEEVAWTPVSVGVDGQTERILARDPDTGLATRMLRFEPGTDTTALGPLRHDFWEEVYILSGELHDLTLDQVFPAGTYACRPPGMPHGPWRSEPGCVTFEVRYPAI